MSQHHLSAQKLGVAYNHARLNRADLEASTRCGCFHCKKTFAASDVRDWTDGGQTALCPKCGIDAVIGDKSVPRAADEDFLRQMRRQWFGAGNA